MKARSPIALELLSQGLVRGSKEFNAAYQREYRKRNPEFREKERKKWREYYKKKGKSWNSERVRNWREKNPEDWRELMKRASVRGLRRRFYARHRERVNEQKKRAGAAKRRAHPTWGLRKAIARFRRGEITVGELVGYCDQAIARLDAKGSRG